MAALPLLVRAVVLSLDNGLGLTPPLGFSTWNHFGPKIDAAILRQTADAMASNGLQAAGYQYVNLDDGWAIGRTSSGQLIPDPKLFPPSAPGKMDGLKIIADYIHQKGLKFGLYTARGSRTCLGRPGSDGHEMIDAQTWADWGIDYLKEDSCGGTTHGTVWEQYARMRDALNKTGRPIYFSVTQGVPYTADGPVREPMHCYGNNVFTTKTWLADGLDPTLLANSYLVEYCNNHDYFGFTGGVPRPGGFLSQLDSQALLTFDNLTKVGAYNDMDMLEVCNGGQSAAEYRSQFSTFAILTSPLILGNDVRNLTAECASIILNKEVIAINQDPLVSRGKLVYQWPDGTWPSIADIGDAEQPCSRQTGCRGGNVVLEPCIQGASNQSWLWKPSSHLSGSNGTLHPASTTALCLTYGGYEETNIGLAGCVNWNIAGVGGQSWIYKGESLIQTPSGGGTNKGLAVFDCAAHSEAKVEVCTLTGADCGPKGLGCPAAFQWEHMTSGANNHVRSKLNPDSCLTAVPPAPTPHSVMNITLQIWAKPLASGAVAALAFNRGNYPIVAQFEWAALKIKKGTKATVRDLWARQDLGHFTDHFSAKVSPHDIVMILVTPAHRGGDKGLV